MCREFRRGGLKDSPRNVRRFRKVQNDNVQTEKMDVTYDSIVVNDIYNVIDRTLQLRRIN